jgi:D-alanine--poly(phosphoribitol) ligase subunit 2
MTTESLLDLLADIAGTGEVRKNPQLAMYDTQVLDSMRTVDLILALDEKYGIQVSPADFDRDAWATPEKFVNDVKSRQAA